MIRVLAFVAAVFSGIMLSTGPAAAVSPADCENTPNGWVDFTLDPEDQSQAVCICRDDPIYKDLQVFGPHLATVAGAPMAITCVGLEVSA
ncbi:hypothetical protein HLB23_31545 [Nocardia uniformis]|uniref:Secreted protein n=1 Tax=Nocardia uniformis TaxID=53432 RepID=A0A849C6G8_9NOCA|nr:hypothetical protein [Nocardia uniformis]NNH74333.1 hypothetical protein [Nocardia uniformis]